MARQARVTMATVAINFLLQGMDLRAHETWDSKEEKQRYPLQMAGEESVSVSMGVGSSPSPSLAAVRKSQRSVCVSGCDENEWP